MNRKTFLQRTTAGVSLAFVPTLAYSRFPAIENEVNPGLTPKIIRDSEGEIHDVIGDIQTHKLTGGETNNQIVEWVDDVEPGVGIPPHVHTREDEIFRVIKGQIEIMVDGETTVLNAGDMAFAPRNIPHSWKVVGTEKAKMSTSAFPAGIEVMFKELASLPPGPPDFARVTEICGRHGINFL